jgi:hypothetical protein
MPFLDKKQDCYKYSYMVTHSHSKTTVGPRAGKEYKMSNKWFGSINNRLLENSKMPEPQVGMGVTECLYSDRSPYEIIEVKDARHITVRALDWKRVDQNGASDCQDYEYFSNPENHTAELFLTKQGQWRQRFGRRLGVTCFYIGSAERYYDFSF